MDFAWIQRKLPLCSVERLALVNELGILKIADDCMKNRHHDQNHLTRVNPLCRVEHRSHALFGEPVDLLNTP